MWLLRRCRATDTAAHIQSTRTGAAALPGGNPCHLYGHHAGAAFGDQFTRSPGVEEAEDAPGQRSIDCHARCVGHGCPCARLLQRAHRQRRLSAHGHRTPLDPGAVGRLVGYRLRPGVAASTFLAFEIDANGDGYAEIDAGARVQSVPGPNQEPQTFETVTPLQARARWNNLGPRLAIPQTRASIENTVVLIDFQDDKKPEYYYLDTKEQPARLIGQYPRIYLQGVNTNLNPNDMLLIDFGVDGVGVEKRVPFRVTKVLLDPDADRTLVGLDYWSRQKSLAAVSDAFSDEPATLEIKRPGSESAAPYIVDDIETDPRQRDYAPAGIRAGTGRATSATEYEHRRSLLLQLARSRNRRICSQRYPASHT